ncbi:hypothetical protein R3P38DRAFT_3224296 [Favolaschia claudopus]|uniref:Uncharacterized protein n=1 Tax=Favolaschia claudopus TaxID=2862362 RepID=A0AAV9ZWK9_9AGAR
MDQFPDGQIPSLGQGFTFPEGTKESYLAVFLECVVYGAYIPVFIESLKVLRRRKLANANHAYLVATTIAMFALISARAIGDIVGSTDNFGSKAILMYQKYSANSRTDNPLQILAQAAAFKVELYYALLVAVADAFIVFRTWVVWNRQWFVALLPFLLYLAACGASIWSLILLHNLGPLVDIVKQVVNPGDIFLILTVCTNIVCTGLIAFRIVHSYRKLASGVPSRRSESMLVVSVLVESAAIYTLLSVALLISTRMNSFASFVISSISSPMIGLVFSHIIVRVGKGTSYGGEQTDRTESTSASMQFTTQPPISVPSNNDNNQGYGRSYELGSMASRRTHSIARTEIQLTLDEDDGEAESRREDASARSVVDLNKQRGAEGVV